MLIAATALGLQSCWVAGDKKSYCRAVAKLLGVPDGLKLVSLLVLGYGEEHAERVVKRPLTEVLHWEKY
jgi:nitroreductase